MLQSKCLTLSKHQILLVEDDPVIQLAHEDILQHAGFHVDVAATGEEALTLCHKHKYQLIFMDINLPDMSGLDITTRIRQSNLQNKNVPIVALTSLSGQKIKKQCLTSGMNEYNHKPISQKMLVLLAEKYLTSAVFH
ncbi:MAG: response regulator [Gammaproteobacteria bacterium]